MGWHYLYFREYIQLELSGKCISRAELDGYIQEKRFQGLRLIPPDCQIVIERSIQSRYKQ